MDLSKLTRAWKNDLFIPFEGGLLTAYEYQDVGSKMEARENGSGWKFFIWAANRHFNSGNKEGFIECLQLASDSLNQPIPADSPAKFSRLPDKPKEVEYLAANAETIWKTMKFKDSKFFISIRDLSN